MVTTGNFYGFSVDKRENYKVTFKDKSGVIITDLEKLTIFNGVTTVTYNNILGGSFEFYNPTSATLTITITHLGDEGVKTFLHRGDGYWLDVIIQIPSPPVLGKLQNSFNFIRWHEAINVFLDSTKLGSKDEEGVFTAINKPLSYYVDCSDDLDFPNNYERDTIKVYQPPFFEGDPVRFHLNFSIPNEIRSLSGLRLGLVDKNGNFKTLSIAQILKYGTVGAADEYTYINFTFGDQKPDNGYRLMIYNLSDGRVYYVSNPIRVEPLDMIKKYPKLQYRNSCNMFGYNYESFGEPLQIQNRIRLDLNMIENQPEIELKQYREQSTGKVRNQKTQTARVIKIESFMYDKGAHDAMLALSVHDEIILNSKVLEVKTAYKIITNKLNPRQKGEIEFYDQSYSTINLHGK